MKQLIHSTGHHVIAAFNEEAVVAAGNDTNDAPVFVVLNPSKETGGGDVSGGNPVHAVTSSVSGDNKALTCAVTRQDKTLALYSVPLTPCDDEESSSSNVDPIVVYKTPKRVGCLAFASVPSGTADGKSMEIIVAGDFEGNAIAYPVKTSGGADSAGSDVSRLLLGHTASMLTGLRLGHSSADNQTRILTSDRDEKVRVSSFPNSFIVEGYLLGHTEYVSSLDVSQNDACPFCVTCGGDGTIRLWDYTTCEELDVVEADEKKSSGGGEEEDNESIEVPLGVTMNPNGNIIAVIWNDSTRLDIFHVTEKKLVKMQPIECSEQPLIATFQADGSLAVLAKDPAYFILFKAILDGNSGQVASFSLMDDNSSQLSKSLRNFGTRKQIAMPESTLEADDLRKEEVSSRQSVRDKEWNNAERKKTDKARIARRKKRKRQEKKAATTAKAMEE